MNQEGMKIVVNTYDSACDCGMWQMSGLPCMHAIVVSMYNREFTRDHVNWYYSKQAWKLTYDDVINLLPDATFSKKKKSKSGWPEIQSKIIKPPEKGKGSTSTGKKVSKNVFNASASTSYRAQTNECSISRAKPNEYNTNKAPTTHMADVFFQIGSNAKP
ncbi:hypothetical protein QYF36_019229 [Acer negundo]|nr:hypothetical protein QYF36_019229 [Acer negundo]